MYPGSSTRGGYGGGYSSRGGGYGGGRSGRGGYRDYGGYPPRASPREHLAQEAIRKSKKENRVYVSNLSFQVRWHDLKDFCSKAGNVVFAEIIQLPNGMSKGCGIVEYSTHEEASRAIKELNEGMLMGRPAFLREDREDDARFGAAAVSSRQTFPGATFQTAHAPSRGPPNVGVPAVFAPPGPRGLYVTGMSPNIGWQDLKDLFRAAGTVMRADINVDHTTGISKGTGVVVMENKSQADAAISMFNGYEFDGGRLEVREDRFYHINAARGAHGGPIGGGGGRGPPPPRGGHGDRGGYSSSRHGDAYGDYPPPGGPRGAAPAGRPFEPRPAAPSTQIFVQNLPWSTANEDLVELFQTTGTVEYAEVLWENGRSKGNGVVQFASIEEAETAIAKFQGYQYGGRSLGLAFNARWKDFTGEHGGVSGAAVGSAVAAENGSDAIIGEDAGERQGDVQDMGVEGDASALPASTNGEAAAQEVDGAMDTA